MILKMMFIGIILLKNMKTFYKTKNILPEELVSKNLIMPFIMVENIRSWSFCEALTQSVAKGITRKWVRQIATSTSPPWIKIYCPVVNKPTLLFSPDSIEIKLKFVSVINECTFIVNKNVYSDKWNHSFNYSIKV